MSASVARWRATARGARTCQTGSWSTSRVVQVLIGPGLSLSSAPIAEIALGAGLGIGGSSRSPAGRTLARALRTDPGPVLEGDTSELDLFIRGGTQRTLPRRLFYAPHSTATCHYYYIIIALLSLRHTRGAYTHLLSRDTIPIAAQPATYTASTQ